MTCCALPPTYKNTFSLCSIDIMRLTGAQQAGVRKHQRYIILASQSGRIVFQRTIAPGKTTDGLFSFSVPVNHSEGNDINVSATSMDWHGMDQEVDLVIGGGKTAPVDHSVLKKADVDMTESQAQSVRKQAAPASKGSKRKSDAGISDIASFMSKDSMARPRETKGESARTQWREHENLKFVAVGQNTTVLQRFGLIPHARTLSVLDCHIEVACGALLRRERQREPRRHCQHRRKSS